MNLVPGVEDFAHAENTTGHLMGEMSYSIRQNLELRKDTFARRTDEFQQQARENSRSFDGVEGLASLSPENAVNGLSVVTSPQLGLAQVQPDVDGKGIDLLFLRSKHVPVPEVCETP